MPRQRRAAATPARSAPSRPQAAPARPAPQQQRSSSTAAPQQAAPPAAAAPQASAGSGLFGQMAATAAGVAVGSSIGHAVGNFFSGGSSSAPVETAQAQPADSQAMDSGMYQSNASSGWAENSACETDVKAFRRCMDDNRGDMSICGWYLDQLKACQQASKQY
ncbi:hypothetical protein FQN57_004871 [Myotisia sp. PD_48]|nr:hypothetical protein FQN57_004871 [Myotisia sp. PD_48]